MQHVTTLETYLTLSCTPFAVFSILAAIICGTAVISNYAFPSQRKFPNIVLVWGCVMDLLLGLYMCVKWIDGPLKKGINAGIARGTFSCSAAIYTILALEIGSAVVGVVVAFTLHSIIVKNADFTNFEKRYYKKILITIWSTSLIVPLFSLFDKLVATNSTMCGLTSTFGSVMMLVPWVILFIIQLRYLLHVIFYIVRTTYVARSIGASSPTYTRAQLWLYARFIGMLFNQLILWLSVNIWNIKNFRGEPITRSHLQILTSIPLFLSINGLIVLLGNKSLKEYIAKKIGYLHEKRRRNTIPTSLEAIVLEESTIPTDFPL